MAHDIHDVTGLRSTVTAVVDDISPDGVPMVVLSGESRQRSAATTLRFPTAAAAADALLGRTVLVCLVPDGLPIVIGVVSDRLWAERGDGDRTEAHAVLPAGEAVHVQADSRRVALDATDEIRLTCGKSSLVMRRDGTVIVRGVKIVSRASGAHRIMGATVGIN